VSAKFATVLANSPALTRLGEFVHIASRTAQTGVGAIIALTPVLWTYPVQVVPDMAGKQPSPHTLVLNLLGNIPETVLILYTFPPSWRRVTRSASFLCQLPTHFIKPIYSSYPTPSNLHIRIFISNFMSMSHLHVQF
jgi:hypothetical protein